MALSQLTLVALATLFFSLMSIVSMRFFIAEDPGAKRGKKIVSGVAGLGILLVLWRLITTLAADLQALVAGVLYFLAVLLFTWAWKANSSRPLDFVGSRREPSQLNTSGPYSLVRHPFYTAYMVAWVASVTAAPYLEIVLVAIFLIGWYLIAAKREEALFLTSPLSDRYRRYQSETGMFIPRFSSKSGGNS